LVNSSEEATDDKVAVAAVVRELVLCGVTDAEAIVGERRPPLLPNEGTFGVCFGEVTPFRTRVVIVAGLRERGVEVVLANRMVELNDSVRHGNQTYWKL
jgi:hypothetical protein